MVLKPQRPNPQFAVSYRGTIFLVTIPAYKELLLSNHRHIERAFVSWKRCCKGYIRYSSFVHGSQGRKLIAAAKRGDNFITIVS